MSVTWRINGHTVTGANECLRGVSLWSDQARTTSQSNYYVIKVGVARLSKVDWLGTWDGSTDTLEARTARDLSGAGSGTVDRLLTEGEALLVEVERVGSPTPSAAGFTVEWALERVGGNSQRPAALFQTVGYLPDAKTRAAVEGLVGQMNSSGVAGWTVAVPLTDPAVEIIDAGADDVYPRLLFSSGDLVEIGSTTTETTMLDGAVTIPANTALLGHALRVSLTGHMQNNTGANRTVRFKVKYGGVTLFDDTTANIATSANIRPMRLHFTLSTRTNDSIVCLFGRVEIGSATAPTAGIGSLSTASVIGSEFGIHGATGISASAANVLDVTATMSNADFTVSTDFASVEVV